MNTTIANSHSHPNITRKDLSANRTLTSITKDWSTLGVSLAAALTLVGCAKRPVPAPQALSAEADRVISRIITGALPAAVDLNAIATLPEPKREQFGKWYFDLRFSNLMRLGETEPPIPSFITNQHTTPLNPKSTFQGEVIAVSKAICGIPQNSALEANLLVTDPYSVSRFSSFPGWVSVNFVDPSQRPPALPARLATNSFQVDSAKRVVGAGSITWMPDDQHFMLFDGPWHSNDRIMKNVSFALARALHTAADDGVVPEGSKPIMKQLDSDLRGAFKFPVNVTSALTLNATNRVTNQPYSGTYTLQLGVASEPLRWVGDFSFFRDDGSFGGASYNFEPVKTALDKHRN